MLFRPEFQTSAGKADICQQTRCHQNYLRIPVDTKQMSVEFRSEKQSTLLNYVFWQDPLGIVIITCIMHIS